jgi:hypothetical protein
MWWGWRAPDGGGFGFDGFSFGYGYGYRYGRGLALRGGWASVVLLPQEAV